MNERIKAKLIELDRLLLELAQICPSDWTAYASEIKTRAACERYFEKIMENISSTAKLVAREERLTIVGDERELFDALAKNNAITAALALRLKQAKGMRNILAHEYGQIDDKLVFHAITKQIERDARDWVNQLQFRFADQP